MKSIEQLKSIDFNILPKSFKVDLLHLVACKKPAVRTKIDSLESLDQLRRWSAINNFSICNDADLYVCIALKKQLAEHILMLDHNPMPHEYSLGVLLGYPQCCSRLIAQIGESNIDDFAKEASQWNFVEKFKRINPSGYLSGSSLVSHIPCSSSCHLSLKIANQAFDFIYKYRHEDIINFSWESWLLDFSYDY